MEFIDLKLSIFSLRVKFTHNCHPRITAVTQRYKKLVGYADADGNIAENRHAISGYAFLIHGGAVSWTAGNYFIIYNRKQVHSRYLCS